VWSGWERSLCIGEFCLSSIWLKLIIVVVTVQNLMKPISSGQWPQQLRLIQKEDLKSAECQTVDFRRKS